MRLSVSWVLDCTASRVSILLLSSPSSAVYRCPCANQNSTDFFAHSNYTELALIELGERDVFPHCGRNTEIDLEGARGPVYPIVTGTFGGVDFLHSVTGEGQFPSSVPLHS